jgi:hypothetical protein
MFLYSDAIVSVEENTLKNHGASSQGEPRLRLRGGEREGVLSPD